MSRSGYSDDWDEAFPNASYLYAANAERAVKGKNGQKFFRDCLSALDAMPVKRLITERLEENGEFCALGALGRAKGLDMTDIDPEDARRVSKVFKIPECIARDVVFENDENGWRYNEQKGETPEQRWTRMRNWVEKHILPDTKDIT
jgi:hypothetical protein